MKKLITGASCILMVLFAMLANVAVVLADVPAPETKSAGTDWGFIAMGVASAFAGALIFLWIGRKLTKRS